MEVNLSNGPVQVSYFKILANEQAHAVVANSMARWFIHIDNNTTLYQNRF
jgi:hypothetical protein